MDLEYALSFWAKYACVDSAVWHAALRLNLFDYLPDEEAGGVPLPVVAKLMNVSERGVRVMTELLVSSDILKVNEQNDLCIQSEAAAALRLPDFVGTLQEAGQWWYPAQQLPLAVRTGESIVYDNRKWDLLAHYTELFLTEPEPPTPMTMKMVVIFDRAARHFLRTQALICAHEMGLLAKLNDQPTPLSLLAVANGASEKGLRILLNTLVKLDLLANNDDHYAYRPEAYRLLNRKSLAAYGQGLRITNMFWQALAQLETAIRHDERSLDLHDPEQSSRFYLALAQYNTRIFPSYFQLIRPIVHTLKQYSSLVNKKALDVGAGSGVWGATFAHSEPTLHITFLDQPGVLAQTRQNIQQLGLINETFLWADDLLSADYGENRFDIIILGQICHTQRPDHLPGLFKKLACALRPGGFLIIADHVLNARRNEPIDYLYFAVREFVSTQGDILSLPEYLTLLDDAGFEEARCYRLSGIDVIVSGSEAQTLPELPISLVKRAAQA